MGSRSRHFGTLLVVVLAVLWGSNFALIAVALDDYSPIEILLGRLTIGAITLTVVVRFRSLPLAPRHLWLKLSVIAATSNVIPYFLFAWAEQSVPSNIAGFLNSLTPIATFLLASVSSKEQVSSSKQIPALAAGLIGVAILIRPWESELGGQRLGQAAILLASLMYAVSYILQKRLIDSNSTPLAGLAATQLGLASLISVPALLFIEPENIGIAETSTLALIALGALGTGCAYDLNYRIIHREGASRASMVLYLLPIVAGVVGVVFLGESMQSSFAAGVSIILVGVWLSRRD